MCSCNIISAFFTNRLLKTGIFNLRTLCKVAPQTEVKKVKKPKRTHSKELNNYLSASPHLMKIKSNIPPRFLKRNRKKPDDLYLIDSQVAKTISKAILPYINNDKTTVIETNPGFGFITNELMEAGVPKIHVYESIASFRENLFKLNTVYPDRLTLFNTDFFSIWKLSYQDRYDNGDRVRQLLSGIDIKEWNEDVVMTIIGAVPSTNFIRHLFLSLIFQFGIMTYGRPELFVCIPPPLYLQLTAGPKTGFQIYRSSSILFQIFCDCEILERVPRKTYLPWDNTMENRLNEKYFNNHIDRDNLYLTRISFKPLPVPIEKLQPLWYFIRHFMISRNNRVIPCMEKWVPGCGLRLIIADPNEDPDMYPYMDIYTKIGNLTAAQMLNLFKTFSSWPEYPESPFLASMETALLKMDHGFDIETRIREDYDHEDENQETVETETETEKENS